MVHTFLYIRIYLFLKAAYFEAGLIPQRLDQLVQERRSKDLQRQSRLSNYLIGIRIGTQARDIT